MPTIAELLARSETHCRGGRWREAAELCQQVLALEPDNAEAHALLGAAHYGLGNLDEAIASYRRAIKLRPDYAEAHYNLANTNVARHRPDEAVAGYRRALELAPNFLLAYNNLAVVLRSQHKLDEAVACCRRALELAPDLPEAHANLALLLADQQNLDAATFHFRRAVELRPRDPEARSNLAVALWKQQQLEEAADCCRQALELAPNHVDACYNLATVLKDQGQWDQAADYFRRALALRPAFPEAYNNLAVVLRDLRRFDEAAGCCQKALELKPDFVEVFNNLGLLRAEEGRLDEGIACYRRALELKPDFVEARNNLAFALVGQTRLDEAETYYREALAMKPDYAGAHFNYALLLLTSGRFAEGWQEYEWRWRRLGKQEPRVPQPRWTGDPLSGRTILLRNEQGLGDMLQFIRYAELLKRQGAHVIVECPQSLARLAARSPGVDSVVTEGDPLPSFDTYLPMLSLPAIFRTSLDNIPANIPYLAPDDESLATWRRELNADPGFKIGIAWQGNPSYAGDRVRSFALAEFEPIARLSGVRLYSLQMAAGREQLTEFARRSPVVDLGDRLGDFHNTAAIMRNLDLVIACDSAPAHLAGALGVPVWLPLAFAPDWRWMLEREDSPWYPTMRLFRQRSAGDWKEVFERIKNALAAILGGRGGG